MSNIKKMLADALRPQAPGVKLPEVGATFVGKIIDLDEATTDDLDGKGQSTKLVILCEAINVNGAMYGAKEGTRDVDLPCVVGEQYALWVRPRSKMMAAIAEACTAKGSDDLAVGATVALQYVGDGEKKKAGQNPPKLYAADYAPPVKSTSVASLIG